MPNKVSGKALGSFPRLGVLVGLTQLRVRNLGGIGTHLVEVQGQAEHTKPALPSGQDFVGSKRVNLRVRG